MLLEMQGHYEKKTCRRREFPQSDQIVHCGYLIAVQQQPSRVSPPCPLISLVNRLQ
jgi:hypothetical protein